MYDDKQSITVEGAVARYIWANPHVYIYVEQLRSGQKVEWEIEGGPPSIMRRLGWSPTTLTVGDQIIVVGHPTKNPAIKAMRPQSIRHGEVVLLDGKTEENRLATADGVASQPARELEGVWVTLFAKDIDDRLDADKLSLTTAGRSAYKRFDEKKMHPSAKCVPYTAPTFMITPDLKRITHREDVLLIEGEFDAAQRTVYLNRPTHEGAPMSLQGHSIGHWEGTSLVIDTMHFADNAVGNAYGLPSGQRKHLIERLTPSADGKSLTYHFELSDPDYLAASVSGDVQWVFRPDRVYAPEQCNPEIARHYTQE
jgi:hypothetical protein